MSESFSQAAARHLYDANVLLNGQRWDNAVYLAGYVVECSFKVLVEKYIDQAAVKKYGHDLAALQCAMRSSVTKVDDMGTLIMYKF